MTRNTTHCQRRSLVLVLVLLFVWGHPNLSNSLSGASADDSGRLLRSTSVRRVNVPHFTGDLKWTESAILWFGRVTDEENYTDVRITYNDTTLYVRVAVIDRYVWWTSSPDQENLEQWDAVTLYLDTAHDGGAAPDGNDYRLLSAFHLGQDSTPYMRAERGNGGGWGTATVPFTTTVTYRAQAGGINNNDGRDKGWSTVYEIPFASLGLSGPPSSGEVWGLGVILHDRDNAAGSPPIADKTWPETAQSGSPGTWGELAFDPPPYQSPPAHVEGNVVIRPGPEDGIDAFVGGTSMCSGETTFDQNFGDDTSLYVENQADYSDYPCFNKSYLRFNLAGIPTGKVIISATLTLHHWSNADWTGAEPSFIQLFSTDDGWDEHAITWNNAPLARENISATWVQVITPDNNPGWPGNPYDWDATKAVAEAYSAGEPVNLVLYSADMAQHSNKYLTSSDTGDWNAVARPTLTVVYGRPTGTVDKQAWPVALNHDEVVTYTLSVIGSDQALTLTDALPDGLSAPLSVSCTLGSAGYNTGQRQVWWTGSPAAGQAVTVTYSVTAQITGPVALSNTAILSDTDGVVATDTAVILVDGYTAFLPFVTKSAP